MKFVIAVVVLALALGAQSSVLPLAPLSYTAVSGPTYAHALPAAVAVHESHGLYAAPALYSAHAYAAPAIVAHAPAVVAAPLAVAHEGTYVAKNRGAEHVAPLPGHLNSAASINLQPAPGTL